MKTAGFDVGAKSMMSLWLLYPSSLASRFCLLRLTKKIIKPTVQAIRTQAPETDPAMIGVLAFCPWRAATSEGFSDRATCWTGVAI